MQIFLFLAFTFGAFISLLNVNYAAQNYDESKRWYWLIMACIFVLNFTICAAMILFVILNLRVDHITI